MKSPASDSSQTSQSKSRAILDRHLIAYAAAATAAGVSLLATSQVAEAKVVYTSANTTIPINGSLSLDLTNDGVSEFSFFLSTYNGGVKKAPPLGYHVEDLTVTPKNGNEVWAAVNSKGFNCAAALPAGVKVGGGAGFQAASALMWGSAASAYSSHPDCNWQGLKRGAFLGLKFKINGETHYGWAHVTLSGATAVLNGYAYETVPNQAILTGKTSGPESAVSFDLLPSSQSQPTLGLLARGAGGISAWRRPEDEQG